MWLRVKPSADMWFKCFVAGQNFPGVLAGESRPVGFYTTCFVRATSKEAAEAETLEVFEEDKRLKLPKGVAPSPDARIIVEEVVEVDAADVPSRAEGFVWYAMDAH